MWSYKFILITTLLLLGQTLSRNKRTLIWGEGASRLQIITGIGIPVDLRLETVIIGSVIKANYVLPMNSSDITRPGVFYSRKKRSLSRWEIYDILAQMLEVRGFGGKSCILQAICELTHQPVDKRNGLFSEIIYTMFNLKSTKEVIRHQGDNEYLAAQQIGRESGELCKMRFPDCTMNFVDMFTI